MLNTFDAQPLSDEVGDANVLEEEAATFNIKYLTSSKLMGLEVKDVDNYWKQIDIEYFGSFVFSPLAAVERSKL